MVVAAKESCRLARVQDLPGSSPVVRKRAVARPSFVKRSWELGLVPETKPSLPVLSWGVVAAEVAESMVAAETTVAAEMTVAANLPKRRLAASVVDRGQLLPFRAGQLSISWHAWAPNFRSGTQLERGNRNRPGQQVVKHSGIHLPIVLRLRKSRSPLVVVRLGNSSSKRPKP